MAQRHEVRGYGLLCIVREMGTFSLMWENGVLCGGLLTTQLHIWNSFVSTNYFVSFSLPVSRSSPPLSKPEAKKIPEKSQKLLSFFLVVLLRSALICALFAWEYFLLMILLHFPSYLFCLLCWRNQCHFNKVWSCGGLSIIHHLILWSVWLITCVGEVVSST